MAIRIIAGDGSPVLSGRTVSDGDAPSCTVFIDGFCSNLKNIDPLDYVPEGYMYKNSQMATNSDGTGRLSVNCTKAADDSGDDNIIRTTYHISMSEVETDLKNHPAITVAGRKEIVQWLATEESRRYNSNGDPQYIDSAGGECTINELSAKKYIRAYEAGIETYNRYFPIIQKITYSKTVPGLLPNGENNESAEDDGSVEGGSIRFSTAGTFDQPDISLSGYADSGWFKSGDELEQSESRMWVRTEEWTWSPEGSASDHSWIYEVSR